VYQKGQTVTGISDEAERRVHERHPLMLDATVSIPDEHYNAILIDISAGGAKFQLKNMPLAAPEPDLPISIHIQPFGGFFGNVIWVDDDFIGMQFDENHKATVSLIHEMVAQSRERAAPVPEMFED